MDTKTIAAVAHNVNAAYCKAIGDESAVVWDDAPDWQKESCEAGVKAILADPTVTPEQLHKAWCAYKVQEGWTFGYTKDSVNKTHPCLVDYAELPLEQKVKDYLMRAVVLTMADKGCSSC